MGETVDMHVSGYHLTEAIGTGGMGSVFKATVEVVDKPVPQGTIVAVKLLHPHLRTVQEFVKRFHREAKLAAQIDHPNVVRVLDEGEEDRKHFIVMEYAEGLKLNDLMGDNQPLSPQQTIEVMNQTCEALKAAAAIEDPDDPGRVRSLVHRDIKPDNLIIQPLDRKQFDTMAQTGDKTALAAIRVKLLDFGLAKDVKALSTILSQTGQSLGTPAYMSPEQCKGEEVDQRSDLYSLGVVAYHMITGTQPFAGPTTVAFAQQHAEEIPPDILKRNPLCPKNLADCIYRCMAKGPKDRYASPAELQADLARVAAGQSVTKVHRFRKKGSFSRKKVAAIAGAGVLVALLAVAGGWFFLTDRAKGDLSAAMQRADLQIASQDYSGAKKTIEDAIAAFPNRPDKAELTVAALDRLKAISAKASEQEAASKEVTESGIKRKHEQEALSAVATIKATMAAGDYQQAIDAANAAILDFSDTPSGKSLPDLLAAATEKLSGQRAAGAIEAKAKHERFIKYRDEGDVAFNAVTPNYAAARTAYEKALAEESDTEVKVRLATCVERTTKQAIAVVDFEEKGQVASAIGTNDAGQTVAKLVLTRFGQDQYDLIERTQLDAILKEQELTIAMVRDNPEKVYGKLKGVKYLVLGEVSKLGNIIVTARVVDVGTGKLRQTAEVSADDARGIKDALTELVKILQMTDTEKKAYLDEKQYPQLLSDARSKALAKDFDGSVALYRRVLSIKSTVDVEDELKKIQADKSTWEKLQADERQKEEDFQKLFAQAKLIADGLPANKDKLSADQKAQARDGLKAIQAALMYKPEDRAALTLKDTLVSCIGPEKEIILDLGNKVSVKTVLIPAGKFLMGAPLDEKDRGNTKYDVQHKVTITKPFYMGVYSVTQQQWQTVMGTQPWKDKEKTKEGVDYPATYISWDDAVAFCKQLSKNTGRIVRLPTDAEREYACRSGSTTRFYYGDDNDYSSLKDYAWYSENTSDMKENYAHQVGQKKPNAWGLFDMHGNICEWCSDWFDLDYYAISPEVDPQGPAEAKKYFPSHVLRGGTWDLLAKACRSANRGFVGDGSSVSWDEVGFRIVVEAK